MAKVKLVMGGKHLWIRTISSTFVGQFINTALFYIIALYGILPTDVLVQSVLTGWILKVLVEVVFTPVTYLVVNKLKKLENEDYYDKNTNFNPLIIKSPF